MFLERDWHSFLLSNFRDVNSGITAFQFCPGVQTSLIPWLGIRALLRHLGIEKVSMIDQTISLIFRKRSSAEERKYCWLVFASWCYNPQFFSAEEIAEHVRAYSRREALRGVFNDYRAGPEDVGQNEDDE